MAEGIITGSLLLLNKLNGGEFSKSDFEYLKKFATIISPFVRNVNKIQQYFTTKIPDDALLKKYEAHGLIGKSKAFIELLNSIEASARCDVRVLLEGESGTGKELIAKAIHQCSSRVQNKFIAIDCGAMPTNLIESELFGHVKGAFTGATYNRKGLVEEANGGTLFMDEITNLPLDMQSKLLRVLQEGEIRLLGSNQTSKVDVRIISASSVSLRKLVEKKQFREDLFYRLNIYPISIPSLAERQKDIPLLADYFIKKFSDRQKKQIDSLHPDVVDFIQQRCWPGNIRELENFVERLVTLTPPDMKSFEENMLPSEFQKEFKKIKRVEKTEHTNLSLEESMADYEEKLIRKALIENDWNQSKAARVLDISEQTIRYKMQKLKILKPE
jgi:two-component system response regulator HydG